jgi:hypothetical protein
MEHVIAGYLRQVWEMSGWLYVVQNRFRPAYSCESQLVTVCQDIADALDEEVRTDAIVIDFSKAFYLVCRLLGAVHWRTTPSGLCGALKRAERILRKEWMLR